MYEVVIVEDNAIQMSELTRMVEQFPKASDLHVTCFSDTDEFENHCRQGGKCDILLMDVIFPNSEEDGIDLVARLAPYLRQSQVIYVTSFMEYCVKAYRTEHVYFLVKPVNQEDFDTAFKKALAKAGMQQTRKLSVQIGNTIRVLLPHKISYIESDRRLVRIHLRNEVVEAYAALSELAEQLPASFIRCHKGFLVNMDYVEEIQSNDIRLITGDMIPISQRKKQWFRKVFLEYLRQR